MPMEYLVAEVDMTKKNMQRDSFKEWHALDKATATQRHYHEQEEAEHEEASLYHRLKASTITH